MAGEVSRPTITVVGRGDRPRLLVADPIEQAIQAGAPAAHWSCHREKDYVAIGHEVDDQELLDGELAARRAAALAYRTASMTRCGPGSTSSGLTAPA